jgi:predicted nucleotidyltransferase
MRKYNFKSTINKTEIFSKYPEVQYYLNDILIQFDPNQVILFGSKARLEADSRSDCDFAIDAEGLVDSESIMGALDIVDMNDVDSDLLGKILNEGVVLYEKSNK